MTADDISQRKPQFVCLPADALDVDIEEYQRISTEKDKTIKKIAKTFNWTAFGALTVAYRTDVGTYFVIDGNHRLIAYRKVFGNSGKIPCMVTDTFSAEEEARLFTICNSDRVMLKSQDKVKAKMCYGDEVTQRIWELVEANGFVPNSSGYKGCACFSAIEQAAELFGWIIVEQAVTILGSMCKPTDRMHGALCQGLCWVLRNTIIPDMYAFVKKLNKAGISYLKLKGDEVLRFKPNVKNFKSGHGYIPYAKAIILYVNKNVRNMSALVVVNDEVDFDD